MLLISGLVQMKTKKDLKCLNKSFTSVASVASQKWLLLPLLEEHCSNVAVHSVFCLYEVI